MAFRMLSLGSGQTVWPETLATEAEASGFPSLKVKEEPKL